MPLLKTRLALLTLLTVTLGLAAPTASAKIHVETAHDASDKPEKLVERIEKAVAKILRKFPPK